MIQSFRSKFKVKMERLCVKVVKENSISRYYFLYTTATTTMTVLYIMYCYVQYITVYSINTVMVSNKA